MQLLKSGFIMSLFIMSIFPFGAYSQNAMTWKELKTLEDKKAPEPLKKSLSSTVKVRGFMMPLDYSAKKISEFLLMPYIPSCMHVPTPEANQIILVKMKEGQAVEASFYPVEVVGDMTIQESKEFESSYEMQGESIKELGDNYEPEVQNISHEGMENQP